MADLEIYDNEQGTYVDITKYLAPEGLTITRTDKATMIETMDGMTHKGRIAVKRKIDCTCRALRSSEVQNIFNLLSDVYITVRVRDPQLGQTIITAVPQGLPAVFKKRERSGEIWWSGISFTLEER